MFLIIDIYHVILEFRCRSLYCAYADSVVQDGTTAGQPEEDRPKKRVVYTTKKKKPAATQQDTEPAPGYSSFGYCACWQWLLE